MLRFNISCQNKQMRNLTGYLSQLVDDDKICLNNNGIDE